MARPTQQAKQACSAMVTAAAFAAVRNRQTTKLKPTAIAFSNGCFTHLCHKDNLSYLLRRCTIVHEAGFGNNEQVFGIARNFLISFYLRMLCKCVDQIQERYLLAHRYYVWDLQLDFTTICTYKPMWE